MAKRRGDGEGSIYQAVDGRWRAEVSLGYKPDGKVKRKIIYGRTRADVSASLKKTLREQQLGINVRPERQTLSDFLQIWLEGTVAPKNRPQTLRSYQWIIESHLKPGLGKLSLEKLGPQRVQDFLAERHASGLSAGTVKHIRATLRAALSQAHRWQLVHQNAAKLVTVPRGERYKPTVLTPEQARVFLAAAKSHRNGSLLTTAITLGLRRGEILGLRWTDVDLQEGMLHVRHSLEREKGAGLRLSPPKSERAKRSLRLPAITLQALVEQRDRQEVDRQWAGSRWKDLDFIFTTSIGSPLPPEKVNGELSAVLTAAKLPKIRFHDLRHTSATLLLSLGVHPKLVQETLGHSTFQLTMDTYSHMMPTLRNEVADRMDSVFAPTPTNAPTKKSTVVIQ